MRARFVVTAVLLALVAGISAANADVSWFGLIGTGTNQVEISAKMSLRTTSGVPIGSMDDVVTIPQGEGLRAQVIFASDGGQQRFEVGYSVAGAPGPDGYTSATYFPSMGYTFEIPCYALNPSVDTPFHIRAKDKKGKSGYVQLLFFKIGTGHRPVTAHEALFIRVACPAPTPPTVSSPATSSTPNWTIDPDAFEENFRRTAEAIAELSEGQQQLAGEITSDRQRIANLEARTAAVESWAQAAIATSQRQQVATPYAGPRIVFTSSVTQTLVVWVRGSRGWERFVEPMYIDPSEDTWVRVESLQSWSAIMLTPSGVVPARDAQGLPVRAGVYSVAPGGACNEVH